ncbi:guanine nucleotide-binding protein-like 1 isoform X3 [Strigops habroptila]|uniref:guanine nucleotide-binding protein-like 1 isoform X3 n=1 Tax=Strigops habroptila TaxID=2489341 RepID=UPI0011CEE990|nr:guanine nucleotide-binding protein-like 1 isoform X3 [Strigops habroptila]
MPRKRPFSAKKKKQQLRDRRERKRGDPPAAPGSGPGSRSGSQERGSDAAAAEAGDPVPPPHRRHDPSRFRLQLGGPRAEALARRRRRAQEEVLELLPESALELDPDTIYGPGLDFPRRPPWSFAMSPEELRAREEAAFGAFLRALQENQHPEGEDDGGDVAPFERNLETWRQLWRVLEMSDVILLITDARHPALNVPPALATHVTRELGKGLILILNKVDLTAPAVATAWSHLLRRRFPTARVVPFTSAPRRDPAPGLQRRQRRGGGWSRAVGPRQLLEACESIVGGEVDLSSWRARLDRAEAAAARGEEEEEEEEEGQQEEEGDGDEAGDGDEDGAMMAPRQWERYRHGVLTLGCVGLILPPPRRTAQRRQVVGAERAGGPQRRQRVPGPWPHPLLPDPFSHPPRPPLRLPRPRLPLPGPPGAAGAGGCLPHLTAAGALLGCGVLGFSPPAATPPPVAAPQFCRRLDSVGYLRSMGGETRLQDSKGSSERRVPGSQQHPAPGGRGTTPALPATPWIRCPEGPVGAAPRDGSAGGTAGAGGAGGPGLCPPRRGVDLGGGRGV